MEETFGIAAFRSRQQVMLFERALRRAGVPAQTVSTPRSISVGCGLSVRFRLEDAQDVADVWHVSRPGNLIGFYEVRRGASGQTTVVPMGIATGYTG